MGCSSAVLAKESVLTTLSAATCHHRLPKSGGVVVAGGGGGGWVPAGEMLLLGPVASGRRSGFSTLTPKHPSPSSGVDEHQSSPLPLDGVFLGGGIIWSQTNHSWFIDTNISRSPSPNQHGANSDSLAPLRAAKEAYTKNREQYDNNKLEMAQKLQALEEEKELLAQQVGCPVC